MRVLIVHTYYILRGGEDLVFETESKFLSDAGIDVRTLAFKNANWTIFNFIFYTFNPVSFFRMLIYLKKHKPDVVHIHNWHFAASPAVIVACKLMKVPTVITLHNHRLISHLDVIHTTRENLSQVFNINNTKKLKINVSTIQKIWVNAHSRIYRASGIWKLADRYIVLTEKSKQLYLQTHFSKVSHKFVVKSNFINGAHLCVKPKKDYMLYVGRLSYEKGVHILLSAIEGTNMKLKIIGDGVLKKEVLSMLEKHPNVEYLGFKDFSYIKEVMAESLVTIFPSITLEGMPMTIIESFACGTPVIASKYSAMENMIQHGHNGFHFELGNVMELRKAMTRFSTMTNVEISKLSENARQTYQDNYSPDININKLISIYSELTQNKDVY